MGLRFEIVVKGKNRTEESTGSMHRVDSTWQEVGNVQLEMYKYFSNLQVHKRYAEETKRSITD